MKCLREYHLDSKQSCKFINCVLNQKIHKQDYFFKATTLRNEAIVKMSQIILSSSKERLQKLRYIFL